MVRTHSKVCEENDSKTNSEESFESEISQTERIIHAIGACYEFDRMNDSTSSDDDNQSGSPCLNDSSVIGSSPSNHEKQIRKLAWESRPNPWLAKW